MSISQYLVKMGNCNRDVISQYGTYELLYQICCILFRPFFVIL